MLTSAAAAAKQLLVLLQFHYQKRNMITTLVFPFTAHDRHHSQPLDFNH